MCTSTSSMYAALVNLTGMRLKIFLLDVSFSLQNPAEVMFVKGSLPTQRFLTAVKLSCSEHLEPPL